MLLGYAINKNQDQKLVGAKRMSKMFPRYRGECPEPEVTKDPSALDDNINDKFSSGFVGCEQSLRHSEKQHMQKTAYGCVVLRDCLGYI